MELIDYEGELDRLRCRDYQKDAVIAAINAWENCRSTLIVLPTGMGKTHVGGSLCKIWEQHKEGRILWIAHRKELIEQAAGRIALLTGTNPDIEMADKHAERHSLLTGSSVVVASIQSLMAGRKCKTCDATGGILDVCPLCDGDGCGDSKCEGRGSIATDTDCPFCLGGRIRRLQKFRPDDFSLIVYDECFPGSTLVSGRHIREIQIGDTVESFNHVTHAVESRQVTHKFISPAKKLVRVHLSSGDWIDCTENHPFFASTAHNTGHYVAAKNLKSYHMVHCITKHQEELQNGSFRKNMCRMRDGFYTEKSNEDTNLFASMQVGETRSQKNNSNCSMFAMQNKRRVQRAVHVGKSQSKPSVLFCRMSNAHNQRRVIRAYGPHKPATRIGTHENKQSNAQSSFTRKNANYTSHTTVGTTSARWKRDRTNCSSAFTRINTRMANGTRSHHRQSGKATAARSSQSLQTRYCQSRLNVCNRSRWVLTRNSQPKSTRCQKGGIFEFARVDRVEVLKQGSDGTFGGVCSDGLVYNLEVEGNNNYFANGILVHNCHHATSSTNRRVKKWFEKNERTKFLGLTATADRSDGAALGQVFQTVAINIELPFAIDNGWLVPIVQKSITCEHLDFTNVRTTAGDLNGRDLEEILATEETLHEMVAPTVDLAGDRRTLIFCVDKTHTKLVCELINRYKKGSANYILGDTKEDERVWLINQHKSGQFQFMVGCGVFTEGYDDPGIQVVAIMRPTKSRALYVQMCGRGTRPIDPPLEATAEERKATIAASTKTGLLILDYVGNAGRHKLITALNLFDGEYSADILDRAKRIAEETDEELPTEELIRRAQQQADEEEQKRKELEEAKRREWMKAREVKYKEQVIDPFGWWDTLPQRIGAAKQGRPASEKQISALLRMGVEPLRLDDLGFSAASAMMETLVNRSKKGLCTYKQSKVMTKNGINPDVSFETARKVMDALARNNWKCSDQIRAIAHPQLQEAGNGVPSAEN